MKLKKIASLCAKSKCIFLYDVPDSCGDVSQWIGDGAACYPITGLPYLEQDNIYAMFDLTDKQADKYFFKHVTAPVGISFKDYEPGEHQLSDGDISITYGGISLKPFRTRAGIKFVRGKHLAPIEDAADLTVFFERKNASGGTYIVAKAGLMIAAIILPYDEVFSDRFVSELNTLAQECRWTYEHPYRPVEEPEDQEAEGQTGLFKVDKNTGEVISGPDTPAAEGEAE